MANRDFFGEDLRKRKGYPSSWPGKKKNDDEYNRSYIPLYKELPGARVVYRGEGGNVTSLDTNINNQRINFWNPKNSLKSNNNQKVNFWNPNINNRRK